MRIAGILGVLVLPSCSGAVEGTARRSGADQPPAPHQYLPTAAEIAKAVGDPLEPAGPPKIGGIDVLPDGIRDSSGATPLDCLGAVTPLMRVVYSDGGVRDVAWRDYSRFGEQLTVSSAEAGVVRMESAEAAQRLFARFVTQWRSCAGTTVTLHAGSGGLDLTVTDVRVDGPVLSATILGDGGDGTSYPTEHAVGVAADCVVDVDVAVTDPDPARRVAAGRASDLVRITLAKLGS